MAQNPSTHFQIVLAPGIEGTFTNALPPSPEESVLEYRHGNSPIFYPIKMPGLGKVGNTVIAGARFENTPELQNWVKAAEAGSLTEPEVQIEYVEQGAPVVIWRLQAASFVNFVPPVTEGNDAMFEQLNMNFEAVNVSAPA
ncbi:MAG: phage tail protein [Pseudomonadota bacterium]